MNIKKTLLLLLTVVLVFSCKQDELLNQNTGAADLSLDISQYDDSNLGLYKGTFTTLDATTASDRGTLEVKILDNVPSRATLTMSSGEIYTLQSTTSVTSGQNTDLSFVNISDTPVSVSFDLSVSTDGTNVEIKNTVLGSRESHVIAAKETSKAPVVPIAGSFLCTSCGTTNWTTGQTFNLLFISDATGAGNGTIDTDFTVNGATFSSVGTANNNQSGCVANGSFTDCTIAGFTNINGPGNDMNWTGIHKYDPAATPQDCSQANGTWTYVSPTFGNLAGTFSSDVQCGPPVNDLCGDAIVVVDGSVETATTSAATTTGEPTDWCVTTNPNGAGVWYKYVSLGANSFVTVNTCGSNYDTKLFVYSDACSATVSACVAGNDDSCGFQSQVVFSEGAAAGAEFLIYAAGYNGATGAFVLNVTTAVPQPGDIFPIATPIVPPAEGAGCATDFEFNGLAYQDSGMTVSCFMDAKIDKFFTWTATTNALTFTAGAGSPGITVWDATGTTEIACFDTLTQGTLTGWAPSQPLVIQVYDRAGSDETVGFCLEEFTFIPPPPFMLNLTCGDTMIDNGEGLNYAANSNDTYSIDAGAGMVPTVTFSEFQIENGWDFMQFYDGADATATLITTTDGGTAASTSGFTSNALNGDAITGTGQFLTAVFLSDGSGQETGFQGVVTCAVPFTGGSSDDRQQVNTIVNRKATVRNRSAQEVADRKKEKLFYQNQK
jgi:hypothetical protein